MIQIKPNNLDGIAENHYLFIAPKVESKLEFYLHLFNSLGNRVSLPAKTNISKAYGLTLNNQYSLVDHFLLAVHKKVKNKCNIMKQDLEDILLRADNSKIDPKFGSADFIGLYNFFLQVKNNLKTIIIGKPKVLNDLVDSKTFETQGQTATKICIENIFSYEDFTRIGFKKNDVAYNSYSLTRSLNLSVCPYCNRNWIVTITKEFDGSKIVNPQLDHYLCKTKYPLFRLSFYNLIPSCDTCNTRLKKSDEFIYGKYIHPYDEGYEKLAFFRSIACNVESSNGYGQDFNISLEFGLVSDKTKGKIIKSHQTFRINEIYEKHGDIIAELYKIKYKQGVNYLDILRNVFKESKLSEEEIYKLAFGNYFSLDDFRKKPFAKLTRDIAFYLGLIRNDGK